MPTSDEVAKLLKDGYSLSEISEIIKDPAKLNAVVNNHGAMRAGTYQPPTISPTWKATKDPFGGKAQDPFMSRNKVTGSIGGSLAKNVSNNTNSGKGALSGLQTMLQKLTDPKGSSVGRGIANIINNVGKEKSRNAALQRVQSSLDHLGRIGGVYMDARAAGVGLPPGQQDDSLNGGMGLPSEEFQTPTFTAKDFTDEANQTASAVYQPRYQAIDMAAENAQKQYGRADQLTKGLYENLAKSIADTASQSAAQYQQATANQAQATDSLQQNIGNTYSSAQNQNAALLRSLGQEESAQAVTAADVADSGWQQGQAAIQGDAQRAAIQTQGQGQANYMNNVKTAEQTQGVVSREGLINTLGQTLAGYDQDRMGLASDRSSAAMQIANQLSDRDLQLQQMNYGGYRDGYEARQSAAAQQQQAGQSAAVLAAQQQEAQWNRNAEWQANRQQQSNVDRDYEMDLSRYNTSLADSAAKARLDQQRWESENSGPTTLAENPDPATATIYQIADALGGDQQAAQQYFDFAGQVATDGNERAQLSMASYVQYAGEKAAAQGLNPRTAQRAAAAYWKNFMGK